MTAARAATAAPPGAAVGGAVLADGAPGGAAASDFEGAGLRERKKQRTWQALHESARELIMQHGLDGVTIDEICAAAEVSPRTFFNYFPSKSAAALGLHEPELDEVALARFRERRGRDGLVDDLCDLVAASLRIPPDRTQTKRLIEARPELAPAMHRWIGDIRVAAFAAVGERVAHETARLAVTLVVTALLDAIHDAPPASRGDLAVRLRARIRAMRELIDG